MEVSNADATAAKAQGTPATLLASTTTWAGLAYSFFGSILFIAGALGFLLSTAAYVQSWLGPFQLGAFAWILGSLSYLAPLLAKAAEASCGTSKGAKESGTPDSDRRPRHPDRQCPWTLGEAGSALYLLAIVAGCSIVFFGPAGIADEVQVTNNLPAMNVLFTVGSAILLVNPLYLLLVSRQWHVLLTLSPGGAAAGAAVDWWFELVVTTPSRPEWPCEWWDRWSCSFRRSTSWRSSGASSSRRTMTRTRSKPLTMTPVKGPIRGLVIWTPVSRI
jgi:hypothetical protein